MSTANPHRKSPFTTNPPTAANRPATGHSADTWKLLEHDDYRALSKTENILQRDSSLATEIFHPEKEQNRTSLYIVMVMPHLVLPRTKSENDGSQNQTLTGQLGMWLNGQFDDLFN